MAEKISDVSKNFHAEHRGVLDLSPYDLYGFGSAALLCSQLAKNS